MIQSIRLHGETISLTAPNCTDIPADLYSADAMKLLVGPNGCGKTETLKTIASAVVAENSSVAISGYPLADYYVIYYSPSRFGAAHLTNSERLDVTHLAQPRHNLRPSTQIFNQIKKSFKTTNTLTLKLRHRSTTGSFNALTLIIEALRKAAYSRSLAQTDPEVLSLITTLKNVRTASEKARSDWTAQHSPNSDWFESDEQMALEKREKDFRNEIVELLQLRVGPTYPAMLRALSWTMERKSRNPADVVLSLLPRLGIGTKSATGHPTAAREFRQNLSRLNSLAGKLGDATLANDAYEIGLRNISDSDVKDIGEIDYQYSSSGLAALVHQLSQIDAAVQRAVKLKQKKLILLIDEGDSFLHIEWQQRYVKFIDDYISAIRDKFDCIQIVLTSHSPILMSDFPKQLVHRFANAFGQEQIGLDAEESAREIRSFAAPLETIVRTTANAGTVGKIAADHIDKLFFKITENLELSASDVSLIDDPILKEYFESYQSRGREIA